MTEGPGCVFDHGIHATKTVDTVQGPMVIFDWERYFRQVGWCPGQDDVSRTLDLYGMWEQPDYERWLTTLSDTAPGVVVDVGAHIGWYTRPARLAGHDVLAVDWDAERRRVHWLNEPSTHFLSMEGLRPVSAQPWSQDVFLKVDIEGREDDAIAATLPWWENRQIHTALLEISPVFEDYYPTMLGRLRAFGYRAELVDGTEVGDPVGWPPQFNAWLVRL